MKSFFGKSSETYVTWDQFNSFLENEKINSETQQELFTQINSNYQQLSQIQSTIKKEIDELRLYFQNLNSNIQQMLQNMEVLANSITNINSEFSSFVIRQQIDEKPVVNPNFNNLENQIKQQQQDFVKIISVLNDSIEQINTKINKLPVSNNSFDKKVLSEINTKINQLEETLNNSIDVLLEKISDRALDDENLPKELKASRCPFKPKQGYCGLWANRINKTDAMIYCLSCLKQSELMDKGIKL